MKFALFCLVLSPCFAQSFDDLAARAQAQLDSDPKAASVLFRQALTQRPDWAEGWLYLGATLYSQKEYKQASDAFQKGLHLAPNNGPGWGFLSLSEAQLNAYDDALRDVQKGQRLGLGNNREFESAVRQSAARILIHESRFDDAISELQPLAKFGDHSPGVVTEAGLCALAIPKYPEDLTPKEAGVVALAGPAQWASTSLHADDAKAGFDKLLQRYPNERGVHYAYGLFLMEQDQAAALAQFEKETTAFPDFWPAWLVLSSLQTKAGEPEKALASVERAQPLAPSTDQWLCAADKGAALLSMGKPGPAIEEFKKALRDRPAVPQLHYYLSRALLRDKQTAEAQRENAEFKRLSEEQNPSP